MSSEAWNLKAALDHLDANAGPTSLGQCAMHVREAIEAGGVTLEHHACAKDYGQSLLDIGFAALAGEPASDFLPGDVAIIQPIPDHPDGHMTMFNGTNWLCDFVQLHGPLPYPGPSYRTLAPPYTVYRMAGAAEATSA
jgi:hypothetical protein